MISFLIFTWLLHVTLVFTIQKSNRSIMELTLSIQIDCVIKLSSIKWVDK